MKYFLPLFLLCMAVACTGKESCEADRGVKTALGRLVITNCSGDKGYPTRTWVSVNDEKLLELPYLSDQDSNKSRALWVFRGDSKMETGCPDRLYRIDLSMTPVKVMAFGVKKACNEFHWASWGEKRSVIALKHNVKFTYENGKMTLPTAGEGLWKAIEPPHAGAGLAESDATAFAEDVPLPK